MEGLPKTFAGWLTLMYIIALPISWIFSKRQDD